MVKPTEMTYASELSKLIDILAKENGLSFTRSSIEEKVDASGRRADILVYDTGGQIALIIEVKRPEIIEDPSEKAPLQQVLKYAEKIEESEGYKVKYVATHNIRFLHLWDTDTEKRVEQFAIVEIDSLMEFGEKLEEISNSFAKFLTWFDKFLMTGEKPRPFSEGAVEILKNYASRIIAAPGILNVQLNDYNTNEGYREMVLNWAVLEGIIESIKPLKRDAIKSILRKLVIQHVVTFINKVLFYNVLKANLTLPEFNIDGTTPSTLHTMTESYFAMAKTQSKDFQTVFDTGIIGSVNLDSSTVLEFQKLVRYLNNIDFAGLSNDIIGSIFESFIGRESRRMLGQFFTPPNVVDLILGFCLKSEEDIILDPACGSGTFLTRAYYRLYYLGRKDHKKRLEQLWGVDIASFPAHLATINLASRNLEDIRIFPRIIHLDFFKIKPDTSVDIGIPQQTLTQLDIADKPQTEIRDLNNSEWTVHIPRFSVVVGNPPYIRQHWMVSKRNLSDLIIDDWPGDKSVKQLPSNSNLYAYFMVHGCRFVYEDGDRVGFVTDRYWLEADFGGPLKSFLLEYYKIVAIIESHTENWFEDVQVMPLLIILEKASNEASRNSNSVRFVRLKKTLSEELPPIMYNIKGIAGLTQETARWQKIDYMINRIENLSVDNNEAVKLDDIGFAEVRTVKQALLHESHLWPLYLRASNSFIEIVEKDRRRKGRRLLAHRKDMYHKKRGETLGEKNWYVLPSKWFNEYSVNKNWVSFGYYDTKDGTQRRMKLPRDFFMPFISKVRPYHKMVVNQSDALSLVFSFGQAPEQLLASGKKEISESLKRYIEYGVQMGVTKRPTVKQRAKNRNWWDLNLEAYDGLPFFIPSVFGGHRLFALLVPDYNTGNPVFSSDNYWELWTKQKEESEYYLEGALLNSILMYANFEFIGRIKVASDQSRTIQTKGRELDLFYYIDPSKIQANLKGKIVKCFKNIASRPFDNLVLELQKPDRQELDRLILCDHLGLGENQFWKFYLDVCSQSVNRARSWVDPERMLKHAIKESECDVNISGSVFMKGIEVNAGRPLKDILQTAIRVTNNVDKKCICVNISRLNSNRLVLDFYQDDVIWNMNSEKEFKLRLISSCVEMSGGKAFHRKISGKRILRIDLPFRVA